MGFEPSQPAASLRRRGGVLVGEVRERTLGYLTAAFGLVAGLAWNEAIKALIEAVYPASRDSVTAKFLYALIVTAVVVAVTLYVFRGTAGKK